MTELELKNLKQFDIVYIVVNGEVKSYKFMWFLDSETIEIQPVDNIILIPVRRRHWNRLLLTNPNLTNA